MAPILEVDRVSKSFRIPSVRRDTIREHAFAMFRPREFERLEVLKEISFAVEPGETLGIMGRNGSGKSTLLKILCGIYPPDGGTVVRRGGITPILELGVGWNPELDAVDNVHLLGTAMGMTIAEVRRDLDEMLAFAEVERFANLQLKHFSSGMAQRLAYAVAFQAVREVLVLDEVFAVGDVGFKAKCESRYRDFAASGVTLLLVTHEPRILASYCTRAFLLSKGATIQEGSGPRIAESYIRHCGLGQ